MATEYGNRNIVTSGLTLCLDAGNLKSYPTSGTTWTDLSKNGNNGTLVNSPTFSSSNGGNIVFDGTNSYYQLGTFSFNTSTSFTISCWFKRNILSSMNNKYLLKTSNDLTGRIWIGVIDESNVYGALYNNTYYGTGNDYWQLVTNNLKDSGWYNLVLVHNKTSLVQKSYLNGVLTSSTNLSGAYNNTSSTMASTTINASISNLLIYSRALSDSEVLQNYNATKWRFQ
jgi:hypothetical protein